MTRTVTIIGAPTNIGIKPYDDGQPRGLDRAPSVLRRHGVVSVVGAVDSGDLVPQPYRDFTRTPGRVRNERELVGYFGQLAGRITDIVANGSFALLLGGDCSIVLASLLGVNRAGRRHVGLAYIDGHADFATPDESLTGSAASMCLGLAIGRGETPLATLGGEGPLVEAGNVALVGRRDEAEPWYGHDALLASAVLDIPDAALLGHGYGSAVDAVLGRVARSDLDGFWIHLDADVVNPEVMPAVDSPEPGGPDMEDLRRLLRPLAAHPKALGMELTIYDPNLDPDDACARRLVDLLGEVFGA